MTRVEHTTRGKGDKQWVIMVLRSATTVNLEVGVIATEGKIYKSGVYRSGNHILLLI
jgi:hypothetical protein